MPPKQRQSARKSIEQEGRILLAISAIQNREIRTICEAARRFDVPRSTLTNRIRGCTLRPEQRANGHKLSCTEEDTLLQWILSIDLCGAAPRPAIVQEMANILLAEHGNQTIRKN